MPRYGRASHGGGISPGGGGNVTTGGGGAQLTTRTFVNTTGSTINSGWFSPMFGMSFKKGDIPSGHYPAVQISGTTQPLSIGLQSYWSDGSLRTCSAFIRGTGSISGSSSVTASIVDGGTTSPGTASNGTTTLRAQLIQVNVTGVTSSSNLSGNYCAQFFNTNKTQLEEFKILDGAAGAVYRCMADFVPANGSFVPTSASEHGRVVAYGYIAMLENSDTSLAGVRFLPRITQPYYANSVTSGVAKGPAAFSTCQWQYGAGPTTVNFTFPYASKSFSSTNGSRVYAAGSAHSYSQGIGDLTTIGCYLTGAGLPINATDPSGSVTLNTTTLYYLGAYYFNFGDITAPTTQITLTRYSDGASSQNSNNLTASANGSFTVNPCLVCNTFGSVFGATSDAKWNYAQMGGNQASDAAVITNLDSTAKAYLKSTGLIPPFDFTASFTADTDSSTWAPNTIGPAPYDNVSGGDHNHLGPWTAWQARYLYNQNTGGESLTRKLAYAAAHTGCSFRDSTTRTIVNVGEANGSSSYTGMPASVSTSISWSDSGASGFTAQPSTESKFGTAKMSTEHGLCFAYPAYLFWGEPQFLDLTLEVGDQSIYQQPDRNPQYPTQKYGLVVRWGPEMRTCAWAFRNLVSAAIVAPGKSDGSALAFDGTKVSKYFYDVVDNNAADFDAVLAVTTGFSSWARTNKFWAPSYWSTSAAAPDFIGQAPGNAQGWQRAYMFTTVALAAKALENSNATTALNNEKTRLLHVFDIPSAGRGAALIATWEELIGKDYSAPFATTMIDSDDALCNSLAGITVSTNSAGFTSSPTRYFRLSVDSTVPLVISNNDSFRFTERTDYGLVPTTSPQIHQSGTYYVRDLQSVGGNVYYFNIAPTKGGIVITVSTTVSGPEAYMQMSNPPASSVHYLTNNEGTQAMESLAQVRWMIAAGVTGLTAVHDDLTTLYANNPILVTSDADASRWTYTASF